MCRKKGKPPSILPQEKKQGFKTVRRDAQEIGLHKTPTTEEGGQAIYLRPNF